MADVLTICAGCRSGDAPARGARLAGYLRDRVGAQTELRVTDCMNVCGKPVSVAMRAPGKAAYLFAGVDPETQAEELVTFARLYAASEDGIIEDARPLGQLRFCLLGRIPA
ncbi:MAG: DUF1636 family protein [Thalassovita sp.]|nr:DUF1636 family protein [Thalassovita sp.]